ncbi:hypothetical protein ColTof4_14425 [Colletotrichum tofieldiae]|nr:hypothetical protein ColTof3_14855 [Colletotrichum tofieldiae]GKT82002.1 hypothetical protein ColTof4_14425 [Colletotrichum tofieldiae]
MNQTEENYPEALDGYPGVPGGFFITNIQMDECLGDPAHLRIDIFIASSTNKPIRLWGRLFSQDSREEGTILQAQEMDIYSTGEMWWLHAKYEPGMEQAHIFWGPEDLCFKLPDVIPPPRVGKAFCDCGRQEAAKRLLQGAETGLHRHDSKLQPVDSPMLYPSAELSLATGVKRKRSFNYEHK